MGGAFEIIRWILSWGAPQRSFSQSPFAGRWSKNSRLRAASIVNSEALAATALK